MTNRILVTGGAGNIGAEIVKRLSARHADFAVMTHTSGAAPTGVTERHGDFLDPASLQRAFAGVDTLFLLFPLVPEMPRMAANAVAAAKAAGVRHIVRSSGAGADAASPAAIAKVHGEIDALVRNSGILHTAPSDQLHAEPGQLLWRRDPGGCALRPAGRRRDGRHRCP
ncbi:MAG: NAD(P)H-binding protein [Phenylobacterium sp.]